MALTVDEYCFYCKIALGTASIAEVVYENERISIFKDHHPAAKHHLVAIPKYHMEDIRALTAAERPLVEEMRRELGKLLIGAYGINPEEAVFGFHVPPFTTIKHLHMSGVGPVSDMGFLPKVVFEPETVWFKTAEAIIKQLSQNEASNQ